MDEIRSQSYSCWYWVLSFFILGLWIYFYKSQSYSCWYWVLSYLQFQIQDEEGKVSILFLLVLGSVYLISFNKKYYKASQSYSCWYWVLSFTLYFYPNQYTGSQSYSCWYWVLSLPLLLLKEL